MCDTFVALSNATRTGSVLLAKSADTEINEAQHVFKKQRQSFSEGAQLRVTHRLIPQASETHEFLIDKSFWLYGGEIGVNEHGVAVGNEAVFSKIESKSDGVILIDLLRLVLERCSTRHQALSMIGEILREFGQGGNCELRGNSHFDGSFIVSDREGALVIETAGSEWAAREVEDFATISNAYTIHENWSACSLASEGKKPADFAAEVEVAEMARCVGAHERQAASHGFLAARVGQIDVRTMADLLRYTGEGDYDPSADALPSRICMHAAPYEYRFWQATGALIADTRGDDVMAWVTATSGNDTSIFKPVFFGVDLPDLGPAPRESYTPGAYWWNHERLHRRAMAAYHEVVPDLRAEIEVLEDKFFGDSETVRRGTAAEKAEFVADCWRRAGELEEKWINRLEQRPYVIQNPEYRKMWDQFNRAASFPLESA